VRRVAGDAGVHDDVGALALEEGGAGRHLVEDGAEAVDVGAVVAAAAFHLLGGHVVRGAHRRGEAGEGEAARLVDAGDAEVEQPQAAVAADHDVLRLQVAVGDAVLVQVVQRIADAAGVAHGLGFGKRLLAFEDPGERLAVEKLHHQVGPALGRVHLDNLEDARVVEAGADLLLTPEAFETGDIALERHKRHLDCDHTAGLAVVRPEDRRHVAAGDQVGQLEAPVEHHPRRKFVRRGDGHGLCGGVLPARIAGWSRIHHLLPVAHFEQLQGNIVFAPAFFGKRHQLFAGVVGMVAADDLADLVVEDAGVQAVGAVHEEVAVLERLGGMKSGWQNGSMPTVRVSSLRWRLAMAWRSSMRPSLTGRAVATWSLDSWKIFFWRMR
jgi:hypothetical protein